MHEHTCDKYIGSLSLKVIRVRDFNTLGLVFEDGTRVQDFNTFGIVLENGVRVGTLYPWACP